jgi:hypothetical protein
VRQQTLSAVEHGSGRFVTGRFDGQDAHIPGILPFAARIIRIPAPASAGRSGNSLLIKGLRF